ncbi:rRNA maturation RNase YbeY [Fulvivirga lutea]|uniref:Endoribonuclease YbeY n=1 Tax=Fulvivirga lutea TaxID=2810512 RepID=A0A974WGY7_9BACT|nr:rRNA maturation RNase YbeY [Fulvivirga lutea]QSE98146.1 rRNA maturation RNase YbeY [Fulvivirga lutea]
MAIHFFNEDVPQPIENSKIVTSWLKKIISENEFELEELNYIFCSDEYLHSINVSYLEHDDYTDIITFDNSEIKNTIEGDIFISTERVTENANSFKVSFQEELHRVMAHGLLHLLGYADKTESQKTEMRKKEDACLSLFSEIK